MTDWCVAAASALMAITGLIMIGYLLAHMYGNLKVFAGAASFDSYAEHLRELGEPILPHTGLLWIIRVVLLASVLGHAYAAFKLWARARQARGGGTAKRYHSTKGRNGVQRSYASFTLRWGGIVIALFVVFHLLNFTWQVINPGGASDSPYQRVVNGFSVWWLVLVYTIAMLAVGFHLRHGTWSAAQTLGLTGTPAARARWNLVAYAVAAVVAGGFAIVPLSILFGVVE